MIDRRTLERAQAPSCHALTTPLLRAPRRHDNSLVEEVSMAEKSRVRSGGSKHDDWQSAVRRIRFLMDTSHVVMQDLAVDLGMRKSDLVEILDGLARPSSHFIEAAARHFNVTVDFLLSGHESGATGAVGAAVARSGKGKKKQGRAGGAGLALKDLAVRHQALLELLVRKGTINAGEYKAAVEQVKFRRSE